MNSSTLSISGLTSSGEQMPKTFKGGVPVVRDLSGETSTSARSYHAVDFVLYQFQPNVVLNIA